MKTPFSVYPSFFNFKPLLIGALLLCSYCSVGQVQIHQINGAVWPKDTSAVYLLKAGTSILNIKLVPQDTTIEQPVFAYQLREVDEAILYTDSTIRYTFLRGGKYHFDYALKSSKKKLQFKTLVINVEEKVTETWWFYPSIIFYILLIIGSVVYFWVIYNLRQNLKLQTVRNRIASDLHDEIGSSLSSIKLDVEKIQTQLNEPKEQLHTNLEEVRQIADEIITNLRDTVWTIKTDNDDFLRLVERIKNTASKLLRNRNIELGFSNELSEKHNFKIGMEQRRNVFLIFKEALHNIIKYAEAKQVIIQFKPSNHDWIEMTISDDGKGFDPKVESDGNGLKNFETRSAESFFKFSLSSAPGKGTQIRLLIPKL